MLTDWVDIKVGDLGQVITGNTPPRKNPEYYGNHTIFIKPTDVSEEQKFTRNPEEHYSEIGFRKYRKSLIPKGSTCVVTIGSIGKKMTKAHTDCFINQAMNAVVPSDEYDEEFVYYLLKYNLPQLKSLDSGTASGRENVSKSSFSSIKLRVPKDKVVQQRIGDILSTYDDLIENNLQRIRLLEELAQRTYEEWFVKFRVKGKGLPIDPETALPEGWRSVPTSFIADFLNGFAFKPADLGAIGLPIIKIKELKNGVTKDTPRNTGSRIPAKYGVKNGDILFSWSGSLEVGVWSDGDGWLNQHLFKVSPRNGVPHEFVFQSLQAALQEFNSLTTGATMKHFKRQELDFVQVILPDSETLEEFDLLTKKSRSLVLNLQTQNRLLKEARDILLPRLMNGEIEV